jgi:hypothetical protein
VQSAFSTVASDAIALQQPHRGLHRARLSTGVSTLTFSTFSPYDYYLKRDSTVVQVTQPRIREGEANRALHNLFAAYLHTVPLPELIKSVERARRDAQLNYVVIYGAACSYCLSRAERLDGSYLRTFALELKEQLALTLAAFVTSILAGPRARKDDKTTKEPPLRQIIEVLQQVMCTHDAEKLAISVLEIYEGR